MTTGAMPSPAQWSAYPQQYMYNHQHSMQYAHSYPVNTSNTGVFPISPISKQPQLNDSGISLTSPMGTKLNCTGTSNNSGTSVLTSSMSSTRSSDLSKISDDLYNSTGSFINNTSSDNSSIYSAIIPVIKTEPTKRFMRPWEANSDSCSNSTSSCSSSDNSSDDTEEEINVVDEKEHIKSDANNNSVITVDRKNSAEISKHKQSASDLSQSLHGYCSNNGQVYYQGHSSNTTPYGYIYPAAYNQQVHPQTIHKHQVPVSSIQQHRNFPSVRAPPNVTVYQQVMPVTHKQAVIHKPVKLEPATPNIQQAKLLIQQSKVYTPAIPQAAATHHISTNYHHLPPQHQQLVLTESAMSSIQHYTHMLYNPDDYFSKGRLNPIATKVLSDWYRSNVRDPYPSNAEVERIAQLGGVTGSQVRKWMANKRVRNNNTVKQNKSARCKQGNKSKVVNCA